MSSAFYLFFFLHPCSLVLDEVKHRRTILTFNKGKKRTAFPPNSDATFKMKTIVWFVLVLSALSAAGKVFLGKLGQKATIECGVSTYTGSLSWHRGSELIIRVIKKNGLPHKGKSEIVKRSSLKDTNLVIDDVKEGDAGQFTCKAGGTTQEHTLLVVSVSVSTPGELQQGSKATLKCQVKGLVPDPTVQWKKPDGSETQKQNFDLDPVQLSHNGIWECTIVHAGETYNETLNIKVKELATTTSPSKTSKNITQPGGPPPKSNDVLGPLGLSWWMWVAVGVGGLVVVFLMVLVIALCRRIKRRKRRLLKIRNAAQQLKPRQYCQCDQPTAAAKLQQGRRGEKPC
ncbi:CD4-2 molecule, tandem duplicate 2 [Thunnus albacares]|uniref:CD4-2 molecule, tandem duplicate 2 n=1 Tax=Thunnus albacares TaxID=8236 RepID=UPI001CF686D9|nr:CD4-2 molecule, tandem duplicate 2 [Thunnus albacares]